MLNQCQFIGNLGADPEIRTFTNGNKVCNLRIACSEKWKNQSGEQQEKTEWIPVSIFQDGLVRVAEQYLKKGSKVFVSGKFRTRKWQDQSGADRYSTEVVLQGYDGKLVMLPSSGQGGGQGGGGGYGGDQGGGQGSGHYDPGHQNPNSGGQGGYGGGDGPDDEIPF
jgi:single-strand DNA-binding protein